MRSGTIPAEKMNPATKRQLRDAFARDQHGAWTCLHSVEFDGPGGRIQLSSGTRLTPGTIFMGVDLPAWLDEHFGVY